MERTTVHISDDTGRIAMLEKRTVGTTANDHNTEASLTRFIYSNHLQSASLELDEDAAVISYEEYHPYGTTAYQANNSDINAVAKRYRYTGKERDEESGFYYHGARYYIPWLCRWTAVDSLESKYAGRTPYCYGGNNPVSYNDPDGMQEKKGSPIPTTGVWETTNTTGYTGEAAPPVVLDEVTIKPSMSGEDLVSALEGLGSMFANGEDPSAGAPVKTYEMTDGLSAGELFERDELGLFSLSGFKALHNIWEKSKAKFNGDSEYYRRIIELKDNGFGYGEYNVRDVLTPTENATKEMLINDLDVLALAGGGPAGTMLGKGSAVKPSTAIQAGENIINVVTSIVKKDDKLLKLAEETFKNNDVLRSEANHLIKQMAKGNVNAGIGTKSIGKGISEMRSRGGARIYFRNFGEDTFEILGYSNKANQPTVIKRLFEIY